VLGAGEGGRLWPSMSRTGALPFELSPAIVAVLVRPMDGQVQIEWWRSLSDSVFFESVIGTEAMDAIRHKTMQECEQQKNASLDSVELRIGNRKGTSRSSQTSLQGTLAQACLTWSHRWNCAISLKSGSSAVLMLAATVRLSACGRLPQIEDNYPEPSPLYNRSSDTSVEIFAHLLTSCKEI
jgi:hypothetical protein